VSDGVAATARRTIAFTRGRHEACECFGDVPAVRAPLRRVGVRAHRSNGMVVESQLELEPTRSRVLQRHPGRTCP
jgi:hypothetical protein